MTDTPRERMLVITDGDLPSLVACMLADRPDATLAWMPPGGGEQSARLDAVERQARALGIRGVVNLAERRAEVDLPDAGPRPGMLLLEAAAQAVAHDCPQVVWPVHCGADLVELAAAADRARLATRLARLDAPQDAVLDLRIRTPLLDLTDDQIAELALDLDAPEDLCWWRLASADVVGAEEARQRWDGAFRRLLTPGGASGAGVAAV